MKTNEEEGEGLKQRGGGEESKQGCTSELYKVARVSKENKKV